MDKFFWLILNYIPLFFPVSDVKCSQEKCLNMNAFYVLYQKYNKTRMIPHKSPNITSKNNLINSKRDAKELFPIESQKITSKNNYCINWFKTRYQGGCAGSKDYVTNQYHGLMLQMNPPSPQPIFIIQKCYFVQL